MIYSNSISVMKKISENEKQNCHPSAKLRQTDLLIDKIVYILYELTREEIAIMEERIENRFS